MTVSLLLVSFGNYSFAQTQQDCIDEADKMISTVNFTQTSGEIFSYVLAVEDAYIQCLEKLGISISEPFYLYGMSSSQAKILLQFNEDCHINAETQNTNNQQQMDEDTNACFMSYVKMVRDVIQNNRPKAELMTISSDTLVVLETSQGKIVIEFFLEDAPNHVRNFMNLTESGFYDGVLFHRVIPGFMIQGGDPNTKDVDNSAWGQGGPGYSIDAEFNSIKHNRGILSMARSQSPDSAGSQFFIVHQNSNFLDQQYTVFGRIVTDESFETLDKITSLEIGPRDIPIDTDEVKITKAITVSRSEVPDLLDLGEPERVVESMDIPPQPTEGTGTQLFENEELDVAFSAPEGWSLQQPPKTEENTPDVVAVGPKIGEINPVISLSISEKNGKTFDDFIQEKNELLQVVVVTGNLEIISQEKLTINGKEAYVTDAEGIFQTNTGSIKVKFKETTISGPDKYYIFAYSNGVDDFDNQLSKYEDSVDSFKILSEPTQKTEIAIDEGGGCLIATATFGSELAPQVQQLREIRDNKLLQTELGTFFMKSFNDFYYSFSPGIADYERENPVFKESVRLTITPLLTSLSLLNYVNMDSEVEVLGYGISLILLNVGMYFVVPAMVIHRFRKYKIHNPK